MQGTSQKTYIDAKSRKIFLGWIVVIRLNLLFLPSKESVRQPLLDAFGDADRVLGANGCFN